MKKYTNKVAMILYLNLLIGFTHGLHEIGFINFIPRKSPLAIWQANYVKAKFKKLGFPSTLIPIESGIPSN